MATITGEAPITRVMRDDDLDRIIEIDSQVLGEKRPDYWEKKVELTEKKSPLPSLLGETVYPDVC